MTPRFYRLKCSEVPSEDRLQRYCDYLIDREITQKFPNNVIGLLRNGMVMPIGAHAVRGIRYSWMGRTVVERDAALSEFIERNYDNWQHALSKESMKQNVCTSSAPKPVSIRILTMPNPVTEPPASLVSGAENPDASTESPTMSPTLSTSEMPSIDTAMIEHPAVNVIKPLVIRGRFAGNEYEAFIDGNVYVSGSFSYVNPFYALAEWYNRMAALDPACRINNFYVE